jgi:DHA2 family multidrug resistance protein
VFLINGPIGILSLVLVQFMVTEPEALIRERRERLAGGVKIDWIGFLLVALFLGCLEIVLDKGQREDWFASSFIIFFSAISALSVVLFVPWELSRKEPMVDIRLFGYRQFATSCLMMLAVGALLFSTTQLIPQLLQTAYGYSATLSGLALMPGGLAMLLVMPMAGALGNYIPPKYTMCAGMLVTGFGMWHTASLAGNADFYFFGLARALQTMALPFLFVPITAASYADLPANKTDEASSLINVARYLGGSLGISAATTLLARNAQVHQTYLVSHLYPSSPQYQGAIHAATQTLTQQGMPPATAPTGAVGLIGQTVAQQSTLLAYIDVFELFAVLAFVLAPLAIILLRTPANPAMRAAAH